MAYEVEVRKVEPQLLAVVRQRATRETLTKQILGSPVWAWMRAHGVASGGHNVVVYFSDGAPGFGVEIGADVLAPFAGDGTVFCSATPSGLAATARHTGPYTGIGKAHDALRAWERSSGRVFSGTSWEVYGHWHEDETKLTTDVFYLLDEEA